MTREQGNSWCLQRGIQLDAENVAQERQSDRLFALPAKVGGRSNLSIQIAHGVRLPALLWIDYPSPWSGIEQLPLFYLVRSAIGDERDLAEPPAHVFEDGTRDALSAFIAMVTYFSWSAELVEANDTFRWAFNDDQFLFFRGSDFERQNEALALVRRFELEEWLQ